MIKVSEHSELDKPLIYINFKILLKAFQQNILFSPIWGSVTILVTLANYTGCFAINVTNCSNKKVRLNAVRFSRLREIFEFLRFVGKTEISLIKYVIFAGLLVLQQILTHRWIANEICIRNTYTWKVLISCTYIQRWPENSHGSFQEVLLNT